MPVNKDMDIHRPDSKFRDYNWTRFLAWVFNPWSVSHHFHDAQKNTSLFFIYFDLVVILDITMCIYYFFYNHGDQISVWFNFTAFSSLIKIFVMLSNLFNESNIILNSMSNTPVSVSQICF